MEEELRIKNLVATTIGILFGLSVLCSVFAFYFVFRIWP